MDELESTLYHPDRLALRLRLFEHLTLPSLSRQDDQRFEVGVLIGDTLPTATRNHLDDLLADIPNVHLIALPPMPHYRATATAFDMLPPNPAASHTATFRLDDDDALHRCTIARTRLIAGQAMELPGAADEPFVIAFNRGLYLRDGNITEHYERLPVAVGMTLVAPTERRINVFRRNHRKATEYFNCYSDVGQPMFLRTFHGGNDSDVVPSGRQGKMSEDQIDEVLCDGFGQDRETLRALVPNA